MPAEAATAIFAIARVAGWIAHAAEEYDEPPLRFRGRASGPPRRVEVSTRRLRLGCQLLRRWQRSADP